MPLPVAGQLGNLKRLLRASGCHLNDKIGPRIYHDTEQRFPVLLVCRVDNLQLSGTGEFSIG